MGYYTYYTMEIMNKNGSILFPITTFRSIDQVLFGDGNSYDEMLNVIKYLGRGYKDEDLYYGLMSEEDAKWYDHEDEMVELSKKFPDFVFVLKGEGEEQGDIWKKYFHNGYVSTIFPEMMWPDFDVKGFVEAHDED